MSGVSNGRAEVRFKLREGPQAAFCRIHFVSTSSGQQDLMEPGIGRATMIVVAVEPHPLPVVADVLCSLVEPGQVLVEVVEQVPEFLNPLSSNVEGPGCAGHAIPLIVSAHQALGRCIREGLGASHKSADPSRAQEDPVEPGSAMPR
jgi:hypothetical protein